MLIAPETLDLPAAFKPLFATQADDGGPVRYRAFYGGRGSAKSHSMTTALLIRARQQPLTILCAREIQRSIRDSVKRLLDRKIQALGFGPQGDGFFQSLDAEIRGRNGSLITFAGLRSNVDSIQSMEGLDIAYVSEARSVSQASLDILIPTVRAAGSEIWFDWNPRLAKDPVDAMFRGKSGPPPRSIVRRVNFDRNPWFPHELREDMEWDRRRDPEKYAHIWLGEYQRNSEARVFKNWRVEAFETPADARFYHGADWGFSVDPTVLVRCFLVDRTLFVDREAYKVGCEIDHTPAMFDQIPTARSWPIRADSARPETISFMQRAGFNITPARKGAGSVADGVEFLKSCDIVVHPDCRHTIDELGLYSYTVDKLTNEVLPVLDDKKNHVIDALRYALEEARQVPFAWYVGA